MKSLIRRFALVATFVVGYSSSVAGATLGVDLTGALADYQISTTNSFTVGYEFSLASSQNVTGLGYWTDGRNSINTQVGLWTSSGGLLGQVGNATSAERVIATTYGEWRFMDFQLALGPGTYIVGSWGQNGMIRAWDGPFVTSVLTYLDGRYSDSDNIFQFPSNGSFANGIFGGNIEFDTAPVPLPAAFPLFAGGLGLLGLLGWRRKRMATAAA